MPVEISIRNTGYKKSAPSSLRANLDSCPVRRHTPKFLYFFVSKRDASCSPICQAMELTNPAVPVLDPMNHNVGTCRDAPLSGALSVFIRWIGNMKGEMKIALRVSAIDRVDSFGRFHIAFFLFCAERIATQCDSITFDLPVIAKDRQFPR